MERWLGRFTLAALLILLCIPAQAQESAIARAEEAWARGDQRTALSEYEQIVEDFPGHPTAWLRLARIYSELELWPEAVEAFEKLIQLGPVDRDLRMEYGDALRSSGEVEKAVEQYNLAVHAASDSVSAESLLTDADEAYLNGQQDTALQLYRRVTKDYPGHPTAWLRLARLLAARNDHSAAADAYSELCELGPVEAAVRMEYGDCLRQSGQLEAAVEQYSLAVKGGADPAVLAEMEPAGPIDMDPRSESSFADEPEDEGDKEYVLPASGDAPASGGKQKGQSGAGGKGKGKDKDKDSSADKESDSAGEGTKNSKQAKKSEEAPSLEELVESFDPPAVDVDNKEKVQARTDAPRLKPQSEPKPEEKSEEDGASARDEPAAEMPGASPAAQDEEDNAPSLRPLGSKDSADFEKPFGSGKKSRFAAENSDDEGPAEDDGSNADNDDVASEDDEQETAGSAGFFHPGRAEKMPQADRFAAYFAQHPPDGETIVLLEGDASPDPALLAEARGHAADDEWDEAVLKYEELIALGDVGVNVRIDYADALAEAGQLDRAEQEFNRVLHADAASIDAKIGLAKVLSLRGELDEAMYLLDQLASDPDAFQKTRLARAYAFYANEYFQETWRDIGDLIASIPGNEDIVDMINSGAPWDQVKSLLESRPGNEEVIELIERLNAAMIPPEEQMPDDPAGKADFLFRRGEYEQALVEYENLSKDDPTNALAFLRLGNIFTWGENYDAAIEAFETYLAMVPGDPEGRLRYGIALALCGRSATAQDELWALISDQNTPAPIYKESVFYFAVATNICGQTKEALKWFREALALDPDNLDYRAAYASSLAGNREFDTAKAQYRLVLDENPLHTQARLGLAQAYAAEGDIESARHLYDELIMDSDPAVVTAAKVGKAYTLLWDGQREEATGLAYAAYREDPENQEVCMLLEKLGEVQGPILSSTYRQSHDSEDNDYSGTTTSLYIPLSADGAQMTIEHEDFSLDNTERSEKSSGTNTKITLLTPLGEEVWWRLAMNMLDISNDEDPSTDHFGWGTGFHIEPSDDWNGGISYQSSMFYETTQLARNAVELEELTLYSDWALGNPNTRLFTSYSNGELSEGNSRDLWIFDLKRINERPGQGIFTYGVVHRRLDYAQTSELGYWDPQNYAYTGGYLDWVDTSDNKLLIDAGLGFGFDSEPGRGSNGVFDYRIGLRARASDNLTLKAGYQTSDARTNASAEDVSYNSKMWYLGGDFQF